MEFNFKHIFDSTIMKYAKQLVNSKAVGHDGLSVKFKGSRGKMAY